MGKLNAMRREHLRSRLQPAGVALAAVPPATHGLTIAEWDELIWLDLQAQMPDTAGPVSHAPHSISTPRDRYGWRSLPGGTPYFGGSQSARMRNTAANR